MGPNLVFIICVELLIKCTQAFFRCHPLYLKEKEVQAPNTVESVDSDIN